MLAYIFPFLLVLLCSLLDASKSISKNNLVVFLVLFFMFFIGLRYASVDYFSYQRIYDYVQYYSEISFPNYIPYNGEKPVESLFSFLILIVKALGGNFSLFIFSIALLSISIKFYAFYRMSNYFILSVFLYLALWMGKDLGQIRNGLASAITLLSIVYVCEKKLIKFNVMAIFSMLIHFSGVLTFPLYFMRYFSHQILMLGFLLFSLIVAFYGGIGTILVEVFSSALGMDDNYRVVRYLDSKFSEEYSVLGGTVLIHFFVSIVSLIYFKRLIKINNYNFILIPMHVYGFCLMMLFVDYGIMFARIKDLLCVPSMTIVVPSFLLLFTKDVRPIFILVFMAIIALLFYVYYPTQPYQFILGG